MSKKRWIAALLVLTVLLTALSFGEGTGLSDVPEDQAYAAPEGSVNVPGEEADPSVLADEEEDFEDEEPEDPEEEEDLTEADGEEDFEDEKPEDPEEEEDLTEADEEEDFEDEEPEDPEADEDLTEPDDEEEYGDEKPEDPEEEEDLTEPDEEEDFEDEEPDDPEEDEDLTEPDDEEEYGDEDPDDPEEDEDLTEPDEEEDFEDEEPDDPEEDEDLTEADEEEEYEDEDPDDPEEDGDEEPDDPEEEEDLTEPDEEEEYADEETDDSSELPGMDSAMIYVFAVEAENGDTDDPEALSGPEYDVFDGSLNPDTAAEEEVYPLSDAEEPVTEEPHTIVFLTGEDGTETEEIRNMDAVSGEKAEISSLAVTPVGTNEQYSTLTFSFTAGDRTYSCLVTGLEETGENSPEAYELLVAAIADSFLAGEVFTLSDQTAMEAFGLSLDLIDAEKTDRVTGDDTNICWAASAADMLEYAGWNKGEDEDAAYQDFRDEFDNGGGTQSAGISWYLNGVNPLQATYKSSGEVAYGRKPENGAAQQQTEGSGGYWKDYAAAQAAPESLESEELEAQLEDAADKLEDGYAAGLGIYFYQNENTVSSAHALTLFGYIREMLEESVGKLLALFVSDSNDRANGETEAPEDRPDEYVMYSLAPFENDQFSSVQLENYSQSTLTAAVGTVSTLAPQASAEKETEGTCDATDTPNLVPTELHLLNADGVTVTQAEAGTAVTVETDFRNRGYETLPAGSAIQYGINIYRDGVLVEQVEQTLEVGDDKGMRPNSGLADSVSVTLDQGGEYTFETQVLGIYSAAGEPVAEAYVSDNHYAGIPRKLTVQAAAQPDDPEETQPEAPEQTRENSASSNTAAEKIYQLTVVLATDTEYRLEFEAAAGSPEAFRSLVNRKTGETVDPEAYQIITGEAGFEISFEESFIRSLNPGNNDFALTWEGGRVLIRITIL